MDKTLIDDQCREELNDAPAEAPDVPETEHDRLPEACTKGELGLSN